MSKPSHIMEDEEEDKHAPNCTCCWCSEPSGYYTQGSEYLKRSMSHDEAVDLLHEVEQSGDTRITATMVYSTHAARGPRYHLMLCLKGRTGWRKLPCRSLAEWHCIRQMWEGL